MKRLTAYVLGNVQGSGYRAKVMTIARAFGLRGYVQNLPDGRVKVVAEGDDADLERFAQALAIKNTIINVTDVKRQYSSATGEYDSFEKMVDEGETDSRLDKAAEYLKELIVVVREGVDVSKENLAVSKENLAVSKEALAVGKENLVVSKAGFQEVNSKLDLILGKQDLMVSKQDLMLDKTDQNLDKQDQTMDMLGQMIGREDIMIEKQAELVEKMEETKKETKGLRSDLKPGLENRLSRIEADIAQIKSKLGL